MQFRDPSPARIDLRPVPIPGTPTASVPFVLRPSAATRRARDRALLVRVACGAIGLLGLSLLVL